MTGDYSLTQNEQCVHCGEDAETPPVESDAPLICATCYYDEDDEIDVRDYTEPGTVPDLWVVSRGDDA